MLNNKINMFQSAGQALPEKPPVDPNIKDADLFVSLIETGGPSSTSPMPGTNNFLQGGFLDPYQSKFKLPKQAFPWEDFSSGVDQPFAGDICGFPIKPIPPKIQKPVIDSPLPVKPAFPTEQIPIEVVQGKPAPKEPVPSEKELVDVKLPVKPALPTEQIPIEVVQGKPAPEKPVPSEKELVDVKLPVKPTLPTEQIPIEVVQGKPAPEKPADPKIQAPVAVNELGRIWSDPMFRGGDGGRFDVSGEVGKVYNLLSDSGVQLNGRFDRFRDDPNGTCVGEVGLTVTGPDGTISQIGFTKDGQATLDGQPLPMSFFGQKQYDLADGGSVQSTFLGGLRVTTAEGYIIELMSQSDYIDVNVRTGQDGVHNGQLPGGLLGHTFDVDKIARNGRTGQGAQGEGAIEGVVQDYEVLGLFDLKPEQISEK